MLAHALLRQMAAAADTALTDAALGRLAAHSWPGNVRELRNVLERARLLARRRSGAPGGGPIEAGDIVLDGAHTAARR